MSLCVLPGWGTEAQALSFLLGTSLQVCQAPSWVLFTVQSSDHSSWEGPCILVSPMSEGFPERAGELGILSFQPKTDQELCHPQPLHALFTYHSGSCR